MKGRAPTFGHPHSFDGLKVCLSLKSPVRPRNDSARTIKAVRFLALESFRITEYFGGKQESYKISQPSGQLKSYVE